MKIEDLAELHAGSHGTSDFMVDYEYRFTKQELYAFCEDLVTFAKIDEIDWCSSLVVKD